MFGRTDYWNHAGKTGALLLVLAALLIGLPLAGAAVAGRDLAPYLEFPPRTQFVAHAPFSWPVFIALAAALAAAVLPFVVRVARARVFRQPRCYPFPWWGWLGIGILTAAWVLAWNRFAWFGALQAHTFTPLWVGYILLVSALTMRRTRRCLLRDRPLRFLALFPLSAAFWWFFEYLNRFVQNWHYAGIAELTAAEYFWRATLPFSTVLPAVLVTRDWLASFPRLDRAFGNFHSIVVPHPAPLAWATLVAAGAGLAAIAAWPDYLFALLWIAPLLIIVPLQAVAGDETIFSRIHAGDWRAVVLPAIAALICGVFWELWNYRSLARWEYTIPFVQRFEVFEMPLLGYAGYLPFGLVCVAFVGLFFNSRAARC